MAEFQTMRDFDAWSKSLKNFEWLKGHVPGATDLDVFVERRGQFLVMETKNYVIGQGVKVPFGQYLALLALSNLEEFTVYLIGETEDPDKFYFLDLGRIAPTKNRTGPVWFKPRQFKGVSKRELGELAEEWWADASSR